MRNFGFYMCTIEGPVCMDRDLLQCLSQCVNLEELICYQLKMEANLQEKQKETTNIDIWDSWDAFDPTNVTNNQINWNVGFMDQECEKMLINCVSKFTKLKILQCEKLLLNNALTVFLETIISFVCFLFFFCVCVCVCVCVCSTNHFF